MNVALSLARLGKQEPSLPALGYGRDTVATYGELAGKAARLAGALCAELAVKPGDRIAIAAWNQPDYVVALYAIWCAGAVAVPLNAKLHAQEIAYILENAGVSVVFASDGLDTAIAAVAPPSLCHLVTLGSDGFTKLLNGEAVAPSHRAGDDLAWLFYTSGTTGRPKGACLSHRNLAAMAYGYLAEVDPTTAGDSIIHAAPMSHGSGLYMIPHIMRGAVNVVPESHGFDPDEIFQLARHWRRMSLFAAPTMVRRLVASRAAADPSSFRTIVYGGGPMYVEDAVDALDAFGPCLAQIYGQGESPMTITVMEKWKIADRRREGWRERLGGVGTPFGFMDVLVVDDEGKPLPADEVGEIVCRGPAVMSGYWNDPDATARALKDGWLYTGDVGTFSKDRALSLRDRSKDVIISGGSNIYPREVEEVLLAHPDIEEVSVIGRPDPEWGEVIIAYCVGSAEPGELDRLCLERIARFKRPKAYVFVEALPKNNYGKVVKTILRKQDLLSVRAP